MAAPDPICQLVERFERNRDAYRSTHYNETQLRREFVDPLFKALGWDVDNTQGYAEAYKDVVHEDAIKIGGAQSSTSAACPYAWLSSATRARRPVMTGQWNWSRTCCNSSLPWSRRRPPTSAAIERQIEATDRQIDQLVYELYGLTEEEIVIVEEATGA